MKRLQCYKLELINNFLFISIDEIKVMIDRALQDVKIGILAANKHLYLTSLLRSEALCLLVNVEPDATEEQKKQALESRDINKYRTELSKWYSLKMMIFHFKAGLEP